MSMYNLIEYSDNYAKTIGSLWQYFRDDDGDGDDIDTEGKDNRKNS